MLNQYVEVLSLVATVREIADHYGLYDRTVRFACERGQIRARRSGGTWIILWTDAEERSK